MDDDDDDDAAKPDTGCASRNSSDSNDAANRKRNKEHRRRLLERKEEDESISIEWDAIVPVCPYGRRERPLDNGQSTPTPLSMLLFILLITDIRVVAEEASSPLHS